jgi:hypothetical protein
MRSATRNGVNIGAYTIEERSPRRVGFRVARTVE